MADFSHTPETGDNFPIEPPRDGALDKILGGLADFFKGIGRGIKHIFSSHHCEVTKFEVSNPVPVNIPAAGGVAAAIGKGFTVTAEFNSDGSECACCEYRQFVRGYFLHLNLPDAGPRIFGGSLDKVLFREDGYTDAAGILRPRGHRQNAGSNVDHYSREQSTGCRYESDDTPQCPQGDEVHLEFLGMIVDLCEDRVIALRTWKVDIP